MSTATAAPISAADAAELRSLVQVIATGVEVLRVFDAATTGHRTRLEAEQKSVLALCVPDALDSDAGMQKFLFAQGRATILQTILAGAPAHRVALMATHKETVQQLARRLQTITGRIKPSRDFENPSRAPLDVAQVAHAEVERLLSGELDQADQYALAEQRRRVGALRFAR